MTSLISNGEFHEHPLHKTLRENWYCDLCDRAFKNTESFYCEQCDFDCCRDCYENDGHPSSGSNNLPLRKSNTFYTNQNNYNNNQNIHTITNESSEDQNIPEYQNPNNNSLYRHLPHYSTVETLHYHCIIKSKEQQYFICNICLTEYNNELCYYCRDCGFYCCLPCFVSHYQRYVVIGNSKKITTKTRIYKDEDDDACCSIF